MTATAHHQHRVTLAVADARQDLTEVADASVWSMDAAETMATLDDVLRAEAQLAEIKARLLQHAEQIRLPAETGSTSTANWHAHRTRTTRPVAHRAMRLAEALDQREATRTALAEGRRDAAAATRLTVWEDGRGRLQGRFTLDALTGPMLKKHLMALAAPRHRASQGPLGERKPTPERLGQAFAELIQRYSTKHLPKAGGLNATVVVLMSLETLMGGLKAAHLDTGETISPSLARKLACEAGIIPAVLDGDSQVLDLGRTRRFHDRYQRIKATIEQRGCAVQGCDYPPGMCHMHHPIAWSRGGGTNRDAIMICPGHHTRAHDPAYTMTKLPSGKYGFHRRT
jgi:hypothetical protein